MSFDEEVLGQRGAVTYLEKALRSDRLPHALLIAGPRGVGKRTLARMLARRVLCEDGSGCGSCGACQQFLQGNHPDFHPLARAEGKTTITLEQLRSVWDALARRSLSGKGPVVLLEEAHSLRSEAQDALLKTLEEPPAGSVLALTTARPEQLRPTIRSRCQRLTLGPLDEEALAEVARRGGLVLPAGFPLSLAGGSWERLQLLVEGGLLELRDLWLDVLSAPGEIDAAWLASSVVEWARRDSAKSRDEGDARTRERARPTGAFSPRGAGPRRPRVEERGELGYALAPRPGEGAREVPDDPVRRRCRRPAGDRPSRRPIPRCQYVALARSREPRSRGARALRSGLICHLSRRSAMDR